MQMLLSEAATLLGGHLRGADVRFRGLATDSRKPLVDPLFIALRGPNFDGHAFVEAARNQGAAAALVAHWVDSPLPQIRVADPLAALGALAAAWRRRFRGRVIALTGSNGKTTVKEMTAALLRQRGSVLATAGNLNNEIGVPLTLAELDRQDFAVIEMGANHPGEIAYLTSLVRPDVALITNAGPAHLQGFGDLPGVACAKGEIFEGLGPDGVAIINADDAFADYWRGLVAGRRVVDFGITRAAAVSAEPIAGDSRACTVHTTGDPVAVRLSLPGRHNLANAVAAVAAATALAPLDSAAIKSALENMPGVDGRLQRLPGPHGCRLINDSYNANPASLAAALEVVMAEAGRAWLVLGDMAELGDEVVALHEQAGRDARRAGVERLYSLGRLGAISARAFGCNALSCADVNELCSRLREDLAAATERPPTVLVKGSRSIRMERVVKGLTAAASASAPAEASS